MIIDTLKDILRHTHSLGLLNTVKMEGVDGTVKVQAIAEDRSIVFNGIVNTKINELENNVAGLARMAILNGYLNFPEFSEPKSKTQIVMSKQGDEVVPTELLFSSPNGHKASYRFMSKGVVEEQIQVPPFKGAEWQVTHKPTNKNLQELAYFNNILGSYEPTFGVLIEDGNLVLSIGSQHSDSSKVPFATNVGIDSFPENIRWPLVPVLSVLKLSGTGDGTIYFSEKGALKIDINSGLGKYEYIFPARN